MKKMNLMPVVPETVGAIMSREMLMFSPLMRAREALARLRQVGVPEDFMSNCYVVDEQGLLLGVFTLRELVMAPDHKRLDQFMTSPRAVLAPDDDQEQAVALMERVDCVELPVVDDEGLLVGTVTADDALEVLREEATEDMERMAAILPSEKPYLQTRIWDIYKNRVVWLLLLMVSAAFTGAIITHYETALAAQVVLTAFIPMLMDTGGNCGSQSSVTVIRGLSLGEIRYSDWLRVAWKEIQVGLLCGVTLAAVNLLRLTLLNHLDFMVAMVVSLTLVVTVIVSKLLGCFLPIAASRVHLDPAVMASPLITTIADAISLVVYFRIATMLLGI
ncbi:magnesium transporter [Lawsonibacter sp. LCP25S3_G6]|uniref:magnesium transporter n=1 Tax=unclassified Lawsonibacter TaxID=2617946 RepID=UPI003F954C65